MALKSQYKWTATQVLHAADFYTVQRELHLLINSGVVLAAPCFPWFSPHHTLRSSLVVVLRILPGPDSAPRRPISSAMGGPMQLPGPGSIGHNQTSPNTKANRHQRLRVDEDTWGHIVLHYGENRDQKSIILSKHKSKCHRRLHVRSQGLEIPTLIRENQEKKKDLDPLLYKVFWTAYI
jgi:hypothetical protein